jgi:hypothetical protein
VWISEVDKNISLGIQKIWLVLDFPILANLSSRSLLAVFLITIVLLKTLIMNLTFALARPKLVISTPTRYSAYSHFTKQNYPLYRNLLSITSSLRHSSTIQERRRKSLHHTLPELHTSLTFKRPALADHIIGRVSIILHIIVIPAILHRRLKLR